MTCNDDLIYKFTDLYFNCELGPFYCVKDISDKLGFSVNDVHAIYELYIEHNFLLRKYKHIECCDSILNFSRVFDIVCVDSIIYIDAENFSIFFDQFELFEYINNFDLTYPYSFIDIFSWIFIIAFKCEGSLIFETFEKDSFLWCCQKYYSTNLNKCLFTLEFKVK